MMNKIKKLIRLLTPIQYFRIGMRASDIFLVSYPRSGVTWIRNIIANTLNYEDMSLNFKGGNHDIPDVNREWFKKANLRKYRYLPNPRFFSAHAEYHPIFSNVIYLTRDVRDVLVSYYNWKKNVYPRFQMPLDEFIMSNNHWPCSWDRHITGWLKKEIKVPFLSVKYEDSLADTYGTMKKILNHFEVQYQENKLLEAIRFSSFENMKKVQNNMLPEGNMRFARKGKVGNWQDELSVTLANSLTEKYKKSLQIAGYL